MSFTFRTLALGSIVVVVGAIAGCRPAAGNDAGVAIDGARHDSGRLGRFLDPCATTADCESGLGCVSGQCLSDPTHDAGMIVRPDGGDMGRPDTDGGPMPGSQGLGEPCDEDTMRCRFGLACRRGVCEGSNDAPTGAGCELTETCAEGLFCSEGVCMTAGTGGVGDTCTSDAGCEAGLRCASGMCSPTGMDDVGEDCLIPTECAAGLNCVSGTCQPSTPMTATGCEADIAAVRTRCATAQPSSPNLCVYDAITPLCATGRSAFIRAVFACLAADDAPPCVTGSDPGNDSVADCVDAAIRAHLTDTDWWLGDRACDCDSACDDDPDDTDYCEAGCEYDLPRSTLALAMMMRVSDVGELNSCIWWDCDDVGECIAASPLNAVTSCF